MNKLIPGFTEQRYRLWRQRFRKWLGREPIGEELAPYRSVLDEVNLAGECLAGKTDGQLQEIAASLKERATRGEVLDDLLVEVPTV